MAIVLTKPPAITTRLVDTTTTPTLVKMFESGKLKPEKLVTHRKTFKTPLLKYNTNHEWPIRRQAQRN